MSRAWACIVCKAKPKIPCRNTIHPGQPLPGRDEHYSRSIPPDPKEDK